MLYHVWKASLLRTSRPYVDDGDDIDFTSLSRLPEHFTYWRFPNPEYYAISPAERPGTLRLSPSELNLTAINGNYAGPSGQAFVGRRQSHTLFTYTVDIDFFPATLEEEVGVSAFLTQNHHLDLGIVMLPDTSGALAPHLRYRGISYVGVPPPIVIPVPTEWVARTLTLEIKAFNSSHYAFSAGPADAASLRRTIVTVSNEPVSWGFTGVLLGPYCTTNGGGGSAPAFVSNWKYIPQGQYRN